MITQDKPPGAAEIASPPATNDENSKLAELRRHNFQDKMDLEAGFLSVLAQPTRLKILYFLRDGEKCACEINPSMAEDPSVVSRHLVKMKEAGILESRKQGVSIFYKITEPQVFEILKLADAIITDTAKRKMIQLTTLID